MLHRSAQGASSATHVEVVRSTGPGLLREAVQLVAGQGRLAALGVRLLHSRYWHPIMPEQKQGPRRAADASVQKLINASYCYHHFVSSWMTHSKAAHSHTDATRRAGKGTGLVPVGQTFRASNEWKSYAVKQTDDADVASYRALPALAYPELERGMGNEDRSRR